jgi:ferritin-like metal-binding protein YciE
MADKDFVIKWLNDAHAMENSLIQVLENHAKDAEGHAQVQSRIQEHIETTRRHAERVEGCIERLGGDTSSMKAGMAKVSGTLQGMSTGAAEDELVKNAISDYAAEQFEVASYRSLIAAAEQLGDQETVSACRENLREDEEMARWLEQQLPAVTQGFIRDKAGQHG